MLLFNKFLSRYKSNNNDTEIELTVVESFVSGKKSPLQYKQLIM